MINTVSKINKPIIGILGGMGPLATADFFYKLVRVMNGEFDHDYNRIIIDSNSQIPDRISALIEGGPDPVPALKKSISQLENYGVNFIAVPCHTVYPFLKKIKTKTKILDMVSSIVRHVTSQSPDKIGILASRGTHQIRLYQDEFSRYNIETIELSDDENTCLVDEVRLRVKRGAIDSKTRKLLSQAVNILLDRGADKVALCCSDLPLALKEPIGNVIDSNQLFAKDVYRFAQNFEDSK